VRKVRLVSQLRLKDWDARDAEYAVTLPERITAEVMAPLRVLLDQVMVGTRGEHPALIVSIQGGKHLNVVAVKPHPTDSRRNGIVGALASRRRCGEVDPSVRDVESLARNKGCSCNSGTGLPRVEGTMSLRLGGVSDTRGPKKQE
jgi:hypothetical protein